jgi:hypothetical protein
MNQHHILLILIPPENPQIIFGKAEPLPTPNGFQKLRHEKNFEYVYFKKTDYEVL